MTTTPFPPLAESRKGRKFDPILYRPRVAIRPDLVVGPGKIELLRAIDTEGSISAAARGMGMSYKRAWSLIDAVNRGFGERLVESTMGGTGGGGAHLTELGRTLIDLYQAIETACVKASAAHLQELKTRIKI